MAPQNGEEPRVPYAEYVLASIPGKEYPKVVMHRIIVLSLLLLIGVVGCEHKPTLQERVDQVLNANKQKIFNAFHPIGTAKNVKVHSVVVEDGPTGKQTIARFTLYWEGPIIKDGFTKMRAVYDSESQRWVRTEILETNGTTNTQVWEGVGGFIQGFVQSQ